MSLSLYHIYILVRQETIHINFSNTPINLLHVVFLNQIKLCSEVVYVILDELCDYESFKSFFFFFFNSFTFSIYILLFM